MYSYICLLYCIIIIGHVDFEVFCNIYLYNSVILLFILIFWPKGLFQNMKSLKYLYLDFSKRRYVKICNQYLYRLRK